MATHSHNSAFSGLDDAHTLVTAGSTDEATISAPVHAIDGVWVHVWAQCQHSCPGTHVPHQDHIITSCTITPVSESHEPPALICGSHQYPSSPSYSTCTEEHILGCGVPGHNANTLSVALQGDNGLPQRHHQTPIRDLPYLQGRVGESLGHQIHRGDPPAPESPTTHHHCTVLRATGNDVVIVWAPGDVQHRGCVATDHRHILVHSSSLEGTAGLLTEGL